jgi:hypothetical protein
VQTLVNASGKKAMRTFFPRSWERVTLSPEVEGRVKSGAGVPGVGKGMRVRLKISDFRCQIAN